MTLGEKIKALRKGKYTQEELAEKLDIHMNTVLRWEQGKRYPTINKLKKLSQILGTSVEYLMDDTDSVKNVKVSASTFDGQDVSDNDNHLPKDESRPYTEKQVNSGMVIYRFGDGSSVEFPPTNEGYKFFKNMLQEVGAVPASAGV